MSYEDPFTSSTSMSKPINKQRKKIAKFIQKGLQKLNKDKVNFDGISNFNTSLKDDFHVCKSSKVVFIVNAGLTTGVDSFTLLEFFISSGFHEIEEVVMVPGKQYSFIVFINSVEAERAVEVISGIKCLPGTIHPVYLACINKAPVIHKEARNLKPPGLLIIENFISDEEEEKLTKLIDWNEVPLCGEGNILKLRQVRHYGYEFQYSSNSVEKSSPCRREIPRELAPICRRLVDQKLMEELPDQVTVNRYLPGQGIPPHIDTHSPFTGEIVSLSIVGSVTMDFCCEDSDENVSEKQHCSVVLPRKSVCVMTGASRYLWTHGICPRKTDVITSAEEPEKLLLRQRSERISFTFRKLRTGDCNCSFPTKCDSQYYGKKNDTSNHIPVKADATELEKDHVLDVYEVIADHFSSTRYKPWPKVMEFIEELPVGSLLLDVGCGNGKYFGKNRGIFELGSDTCSKLLEICRNREFDVTLSNCISLPFRQDAFDSVMCIAVIHHLASQERREKAVREIARVLRPGGKGLIYVWAFEQRKEKMSSYLKQKRSNRTGEGAISNVKESPLGTQLFNPCDSSSDLKNCFDNETLKLEALSIHENRTDFAEQDLFVPWKIKPEKYRPHSSKSMIESPNQHSSPVYHRYYHVFREGELEELIGRFRTLEIIKSYYDEGNWCISFKKLFEHNK